MEKHVAKAPPAMASKDINAVYKKMALELHPDKGGDPEKFQELQEMKAALGKLVEAFCLVNHAG